jgi:predicted DCC family thiol-disulfide oxidoreductase YuxK
VFSRNVAAMTDARLLLLFDGECVLCCAHVDFVLRRDPAARVRLGTIQSVAGVALRQAHGLPTEGFASIVVIDGARVLERSDAVIRVLRELTPPWPAIGRLFGLVPRKLRDAGYDLVARWRYRIFGRRTTCLVPTPDIADRFIS